MNLSLYRTQYLPTCVKGNLYVDGNLECFTLEPPLRFDGQVNVPNKTCVNEGTYVVQRHNSMKFGRIVPMLMNVPNRENVEMHPLNLPSQTEGCIGVGKQWIDAPEIGQSDLAFADLMALITPAWDAQAVVLIAIESLFGMPHA